jgi:hypothetical protein
VSQSTPRFSAVTRRAFLSGLSIAAIAATGACGATPSGNTSSPDTAAPSTASSPSASPSAPDSSAASSSGSAVKTIPAGAKATVSWTYAASGGMARNPYMAVWIEDSTGAYVKTLALYHRANGDNWLDSLSSWYASSGGADTTTSGTVPAGSYTATWDGSAATGGQADQGSYYVCVESAVEHGSESLVRQRVTFGTSSSKTTLSPTGSIAEAAVDYTV